MNQTHDLLEETLAGFRAWLEYKPVEFLCNGEWFTLNNGFEVKFTKDMRLRPKPEPKLRAWKAEEVPVGAVTRLIGDPCTQRMITARHPTGVLMPDTTVSFEELLNGREHSTDGGKTWKPCGIMEDAK